MTKPILDKINSFDSSYDYTIGFTYRGNQTYSHRLIITNASTSTQVYDNTYVGFELYHVIPANTLANDEQYFAQVQCFDKDGNASVLSEPAYFRCIKTPEFYFEGLSNNTNIHNSSIQLIMHYYQGAGEKLKNYQFFLYDINKINVLNSEVYTTDDLNYRFTGLEDNKQYYVRATGMTVHGLELDTGFIKVNVSYKEPECDTKLLLSCDRCKGYISWATNIIVINCTTPKAYTFDNGFVDVVDKVIEYNYGYIINGDFELKLIGKKLNRSGKLLTMSNGINTITLSSHVYDTDGNMYFHLSVENGLSTYSRYSENMQLTEDDVLEFVITRKNNLYKLSIYKM